MTKTEPVTKTWGPDAVGLLPICIAIYVVMDSLLISRAWFLDGNRLLVAMALPLSQCSLAAIWSGISGSSPYVRFAVPALGVLVSWYLMTQIMPWGIGEPASAAWALALTVQVLVIVLAIHLYPLVSDLTAEGKGKEKLVKQIRSRFSFELRTLMLWTTAIAFGFGFIQFGRVQWGWTALVADWEFFNTILLIGVLNGLVAVCWLWALATGSWRVRGARVAIVAVFIGCLWLAFPYLVNWTGATTAVGASATLVLLVAQSVLLAGSLTLITIPPTSTL